MFSPVCPYVLVFAAVLGHRVREAPGLEENTVTGIGLRRKGTAVGGVAAPKDQCIENLVACDAIKSPLHSLHSGREETPGTSDGTITMTQRIAKQIADAMRLIGHFVEILRGAVTSSAGEPSQALAPMMAATR
jgi:hypothetical protein